MIEDVFEFRQLVRPIGPWGQTNLKKAVREGRLVVRKAGRKTVVLRSDYERFLHALPVKEVRGAPKTV